MHARVTRIALVLTAALCVPWGLDPDRGSPVAGEVYAAGAGSVRSGHGLPAYGHDLERAAAHYDSLCRAHPSDPVPAYWRARSLELLGDLHRAYCGYLRLEALVGGDQTGGLAGARRLALERRWADAVAEEGMPIRRVFAPASGPLPLLLLPPDNLGPPEGELFAMVWTYLLYDALRQAGVCVIPLSVTLAAQEALASGRAVRVPVSVASQPVNTVEGLRGHLSLLSGLDAMPYLAERDGGWGEDLQSALIRFQQEVGIPPTGQADVVTQRRLQAALETWLLGLPPPLDPRDLPTMAAWLGAGSIARGTIQPEGGALTVRLGILDSSGSAIDADPILVSVDPSRAGDPALNTARLIAQALGKTPAGGVVNGPAPEHFEQIIESLLLLDRGMSQLAVQRWSRAPAAWFSWGYLADVRRSNEIRGFEIGVLEERIHRTWRRRPVLDREAALDRMLGGLGRPGPASGPSAWPDPDPARVLGNEGIVRIRGEVQ